MAGPAQWPYLSAFSPSSAVITAAAEAVSASPVAAKKQRSTAARRRSTLAQSFCAKRSRETRMAALA